MGTIFYFTNATPSGSPYPNGDTAQFSPKAVHDWPYSRISLQMSTASANSDNALGGDFLVDPLIHYSHVRTFVSRPLASNFTMSGTMSFAAYMGYSSHKVVGGVSYWTDIVPSIYLYGFRPSYGVLIGTLYKGDLSQLPYNTDQYLTMTFMPTSTVFAEGDRLVCEVYFHHTSSNWEGYAFEHFHFNTPYSYLSISQNVGELEMSQTSLDLNYAIYNRRSHDRVLPYRMGFYPISTHFSAPYFIYSNRYIELYMETMSSARGKASLIIAPRSSLGLTYPVTDYSQKWVLPEPSLHRFKMIDDFEGYYDLADAAAHWTVSDGLVTFSAIKTFSAENFSDYEILTFYSNADRPTIIKTSFEDVFGASSETMSFLLTERYQRNEMKIIWGNCNPYAVTKFKIVGDYDGRVIVDDIFLLDYEPETENVDWMKMNLVDMDFGRSAKMSTFKIPFKQSEVLQFMGEYNGEGQLKIRSMDTMQSQFLSEMMKTNTPLYFRYKNIGLPIVLRDISRTFRQIIPREIASDIGIPFYEIYDYSMF